MDEFLLCEEWFKQSWYDYDTAHAMFQAGRYVYAVFMCHMAIEKALKGLFHRLLQKVPPKTHDLFYLLAVMNYQLPEEKLSFVNVLNDAHIRTRYPDNLDKILD